MRILTAMLLGVLITTGVGGCAGQKAREGVLLPAMRSSWYGIRQDVLRGVQDATVSGENAPAAHAERQAEDMTRAIDLGEIDVISAVDWLALKAMASRGIEARLTAGEIGPNVAATYEERLTQFERSLATLKGS